jgi:hypothetical protein
MPTLSLRSTRHSGLGMPDPDEHALAEVQVFPLPMHAIERIARPPYLGSELTRSIAKLFHGALLAGIGMSRGRPRPARLGHPIPDAYVPPNWVTTASIVSPRQAVFTRHLVNDFEELTLVVSVAFLVVAPDGEDPDRQYDHKQH